MRRAAVILALVGAGAVSAVTLIGAVAASAVAAQPRHPVYLIYDGFVRNADGSLTPGVRLLQRQPRRGDGRLGGQRVPPRRVRP